MFHGSLRPDYVMGALIAAFLAVTGAAGLLNPSMYLPFIASSLVAGMPVQDFVSLLAAPLLIAAMVYTGRGSVRAFVLWAGLMVYAGYYYAFFCFGFAYTLYYPLYLAIMGLSLYSLLGLLHGANVQAFAGHVDGHMPARFLSLVLAMPLLLTPLWLMGIVKGISTQQMGAADLVFVLDLAFLIPAMTFAAVQMWRRRPAGYLLGGVLLVKAAISGILLTGGSLRQFLLGYQTGPDVAMYVFLLVAGVIGLLLYLKNIRRLPVESHTR